MSDAEMEDRIFGMSEADVFFAKIEMQYSIIEKLCSQERFQDQFTVTEFYNSYKEACQQAEIEINNQYWVMTRLIKDGLVFISYQGELGFFNGPANPPPF